MKIFRNRTIKPLWTSFLLLALFLVILGSGFSAFGQEIPNPIKARSFNQLVVNLADAIRKVAIPLAVIGIVIAGFRMILAATSGNAGKLQEARKLLYWLLIGTAVVVGATILAQAVVNTVSNL